MKRIIAAFLILFAAVFPICPAVSKASQPDRAYTYDDEYNAVPATNSFQVKTVIDEISLDGSGFSDAQDLCVDSHDQIYLLDSGKGRVLWIDENYKLKSVIDTFLYNGEAIALAPGAQGIFYQEGTGKLYIADTEADRIVVSDRQGIVSDIYTKPVSDLLSADIKYKPAKIIVDNLGIMYIISRNVNTGALMVDSENHFLGFYGINTIKQTFKVKMEFMWRRMLTEEQNRQSETSFQPTELNNLFWSKDRFIYAVSPSNDTISSPVVKLNAVGDNVLKTAGLYFGDLSVNEIIPPGKDKIDPDDKNVPVFSDITVDSEEVFTILDSKTGKLYQYDDSCNLLSAFGGLGYQKGLFTLPVAIESNSKNELLVLDSKKNTVTVMEQTYYGKMIREAIFLHNQGLYEEALTPWFEVLRMNANYYIAYIGIGKAYMNMKDYEKAKYYFEVGGDKENYSAAKAALRAEALWKNFAGISAAAVVLMIVILTYDGLKKYAVKAVCILKKKRKGVRK